MRRGRIIGFSVALASILLVAFPGTASAVTDVPWDCRSSGQVCVYRDENGFGAWSDFAGAKNDYYFTYFEVTTNCHNTCFLNDQIGSMDSWDTTRKVRFFKDKNYDGVRQTLGAFARDNLADYNNTYSSHCWNDGKALQSDGQKDVDCGSF